MEILVRFPLQITLVSTLTTQSMTGHSPSILYISAYGGDVSGNSGQISSPNYPRQYPHNTEYDWTITVAVGMRVRITFVTMDMEAYNCAYDYVRVSYFYRHK